MAERDVGALVVKSSSFWRMARRSLLVSPGSSLTARRSLYF